MVSPSWSSALRAEGVALHAAAFARRVAAVGVRAVRNQSALRRERCATSRPLQRWSPIARRNRAARGGRMFGGPSSTVPPHALPAERQTFGTHRLGADGTEERPPRVERRRAKLMVSHNATAQGLALPARVPAETKPDECSPARERTAAADVCNSGACVARVVRTRAPACPLRQFEPARESPADNRRRQAPRSRQRSG